MADTAKLELAKAYIQIVPTTKDMKGSLSSLLDSDSEKAGRGAGEKAGKGISEGITKAAGVVGKATGAAITAGAAFIGKTIYDAVVDYADYEQLIGGVETLFGESAWRVKDYAELAYKSAGLSANAYMETVTSFSSSLVKSLGGDTAQAAALANMAIQDMSDNANKMGSDMESIQNAYQGFAKQNYTMLDNLKLGYGGTKSEMERLIARANELKEAQGEAADLTIDSYANVVEAIHLVQTEIGITGTTAKEAGTTISGSFNTMKAAWENMLTSMMAPDGFNSDTITAFVESVFGDGTDENKGFLGNIVPVLAAGSPRLIEGLNMLIEEAAPYVPDILKTLLPSMVEGGVVLAEALAEELPEILEIVWDAIAEGFDTMIGTLQEKFPEYAEELEGFKEVTGGTASFIQRLFSGDIKGAFESFTDTVSGVVDFSQGTLDGFGGWLDKVFSAEWADSLGALGVPLKEFLGMIGGTVDGAIEIVSAILEFIRDIFKGNWSELWGDVLNIFKGIWDMISAIPKAIINGIISGLNGFVDAVNTAIRGLNKISVTIPDWVPLIGGNTWGLNIREMGHIPYLESGAVLEKGQVGFLEGNGAEAVVPLENNSKWIRAVADDLRKETGNSGGIIDELKEIVEVVKDLRNRKIVMDSGETVGALSGDMDDAIGDNAVYDGRSLAWA